jgi:cytochrome c oxidase subunit 2
MYLKKNYPYFLLSSLYLLTTAATLDAAEPWQLGLQDPATPIMIGIINFHNNLMFFITLIAIAVSWLLGRCLFLYAQKNDSVPFKIDGMFTHSIALEVIWTILPAVVLLFIAIPSFALLYSMDELIDPSLTIKVVGHQWYWSYELDDNASEASLLENDYLAKSPSFNSTDVQEGIAFDAYMTSFEDLQEGHLRLLEVDNRLILPVNLHIRVLVSAADVLHSWAIPSFGVKVDACPGRLNQASLFILREGVYYGQCSEICGINHGFMPIVIRAMHYLDFVDWALSKWDLENRVNLCYVWFSQKP